MDEWLDEVMPKLVQRAEKDRHYQELFARYMEAEKSYLEIIGNLSEESQLEVDNYVALCEELEYRKSQIAYKLGFQAGFVSNEIAFDAE